MRTFSLVAVWLLFESAAFGQGTFANLDFEASLVPPSQPAGAVPVDEALPGWTAYIGTITVQRSVTTPCPRLSRYFPDRAECRGSGEH